MSRSNRRAARFAWLIAPFVLISGCAGPQPGALRGPDGAGRAPDAEFDASTGAIRGFLLNEEELGIGGAEILLRPGDHVTRSAENGGYVFSYLQPGAYTLLVSKIGFEDQTTPAITVVTRQATTQDLHLVEVPVYEPRQRVHGPFEGFVQCRMATPVSSGPCGFLPLVGDTPVSDAVDNNDKNRLDFQLDGPDWEQILFEARWTPSTAATNSKMTQVFSYSDRTSTHWFADSGSCPSPCQFVFTKGQKGPGGQLPNDAQPKEPNGNLTLTTWLTLPFARVNATAPAESHVASAAYELRFQLAATVFYSRRAPEGYTAFDDA